MKLTEIKIAKPVSKEIDRLENIEVNIDLDAGQATFTIDLNADFAPSGSGRSLMIAKAKNTMIRLNEIVSTLNITWYIPKSKNNLS